jgi:hypothetical protein
MRRMGAVVLSAVAVRGSFSGGSIDRHKLNVNMPFMHEIKLCYRFLAN